MKHTIVPAKHWPARPRRGLRSIAVAFAAALVLASCGGEEAATDPDAADGVELATVPNPQPVGVADPAVIEEEEDEQVDESCRPTASFRPDGPRPAPGNMPPGSTMAEIAQRGSLIAGVDQTTFLFGFRNPDNGQIEGFDIDIAKQIANAIFGDPDAIQFVVLTSAEREDAVMEGRVDVVVRTMTANCERWENVNFSTIYYEAGQRVLVREDAEYSSINDLGGQKMCATHGSTSIGNIADAGSQPVPVAVNDWADCLVMLQQNQVEAVSTDDTILAGLQAQDSHTKMVGPPFTAEPYGIAMHKDATDLVRFVNALLEDIRADGTWARIHQRWIGETTGAETPPPPAAEYRD
jgi:polar amino acid transport system substrate-binding protein